MPNAALGARSRRHYLEIHPARCTASTIAHQPVVDTSMCERMPGPGYQRSPSTRRSARPARIASGTKP